MLVELRRHDELDDHHEVSASSGPEIGDAPSGDPEQGPVLGAGLDAGNALT